MVVEGVEGTLIFGRGPSFFRKKSVAKSRVFRQKNEKAPPEATAAAGGCKSLSALESMFGKKIGGFGASESKKKGRSPLELSPEGLPRFCGISQGSSQPGRGNNLLGGYWKPGRGNNLLGG